MALANLSWYCSLPAALKTSMTRASDRSSFSDLVASWIYKEEEEGSEAVT